MDCRQPVLTSQRLTLRPFTLADAEKVAELAGDWRIADTTEAVPHPYGLELAEQWIVSHLPLGCAGKRWFMGFLTGLMPAS